MKGLYRAERYDTLTGDTSPLPCTQRNGFTEIPVFMYEYESLLVRMIPCEHPSALPASKPAAAVRRIPLASRVPFVLNEPNVLLLDMAEYALDDQPYAPAEELLRADNACRRQLGWPVRQEAVVQPWTLAPETPEHTVRLRFAHTKRDGGGGAEARDGASGNGGHPIQRPDGFRLAGRILCR